MVSSSLLPRIFLGAAIALTVVSGIKSYSNGTRLKTALEEKDTAAGNAQTLSEQVKKATAEASNAKKELKALVDAKSAAEKNASSSSEKMDELKSQLAAANTKAQALETANKQLQDKVAAATNAPVAAPVQDPELLKKVAEAEAKAAEKEQVLKAFQAKSEDVEKKAAALEAENARRIAGLNKPGLEGKVLAVNPSWNFVVLSIGDRQGVVAGSSLIVKRAGSMVAKLRVTSVEPSTSIADIQAGSLSKGAAVQPGDVVIFPGS